MVSLKLKLIFSLLYLLSFIYIFTKFINSLLNLWFWFYLNSFIFTSRLIKDQFFYTDKVGYINSIVSKAGFIGSKVKVEVLVVLVLAKLFLKRQSIYFELNFPPVTIYSLILSLVHSIGLSSYNILKSDYRTVIYLSFFNLYSINLKKVLKVTDSYLVVILKNFYYKSAKVLAVKLLQVVVCYIIKSIFYNLVLYKFTNFSLLISLDCILSPSLHLFHPFLTCALIFNILIIVLLGSILGSK